MTKQSVINHLWEKNVAGVDELGHVVDAVWEVLQLPPKGNLIRVGGELDQKLTIGEGEAKATVLIFPDDSNVVKLNHLKGTDVVVFGIEVEKEEETPKGPTEIEQLAQANETGYESEDDDDNDDDEPEVIEASEEAPSGKAKRK